MSVQKHQDKKEPVSEVWGEIAIDCLLAFIFLGVCFLSFFTFPEIANKPLLVTGCLTVVFLAVMIAKTIRSKIFESYVQNDLKQKNQSEEMLSLITENVPGFIAYIDKDERYQFINKYGLSILEYEDQKIIGETLKTVHKDNYDTFADVIEKALEGEEAVLETQVYAPIINENIHIYGVAKPAINESGNVKGFYVIAQDVTELKVTEQKLARAKKDAEKASNAKSEFLANMSHEIRTPMNGIMGLTSLLKKSNLNEKQAKYVSMIENSGSMLVTIINDILDISKIESNKMVLNIKKFDLTTRLREIFSVFEQQANEKGLHMSLKMSDNIPRFVYADPVRLEQIINNLLSNALKYTKQGSIRMACILIEKGESTARIYFEVADTGMGIPKSEQNTLFDKFTQIRDRKKEDIEGTGLGLAIFKKLVEMMGGQLGLESKEGAGSKFWFELHFDIVNEVQNDIPALGVSPVSSSDTKFDGHVLLVEDIEANRLIIKDLLETYGLRVDEARDGQEAVDMALNNDYDLILMDIRMPVMDGIEATEIIMEHQREERNYTPIIALTAYAMGSQMQECLSAGMSDFLTKPLKEEDLCMVMREWLGGHDPLEAIALQEEQQKRWEKMKFEAAPSGAKTSDLKIDTSFMDLLYQENPEKAAEIAKSTIKDLENNLKPLEKHLKEGNLEEAAKLAHSLKSLSAQAGALPFSEKARQIEEKCSNGQNEDDFDQLLLEMNSIFGDFKKILIQYTDNPA